MLSLVGCGKSQSSLDFKIGLVTGTVSQGEEEFRAGEDLVKKYGSAIKHGTYPDKFTQEQETTIAQITSLASDPEVKAIVVVQAVPGTAAAIDKIKEKRDDILFIAGVPHEDPELICSRADIVLDVEKQSSNLQRKWELKTSYTTHSQDTCPMSFLLKEEIYSKKFVMK